MKAYGVLLAAVALFAGQPAAAQSDDEGLLNAVAYKALPPGVAIAVRPLDDSDENLEVQKIFESELAANGFAVARTGALVMTFETREEVGAWSDGGRRTILELQGRGDSLGGEQQKVRLNIFDSSSGGMLNPGRESGTSIVTPSQYRIDATIDDRESGERLWQAWAVADLRQSDGPALTKAMVPEMVKILGQTVKRQPFKLP